ncbi:bacterial ammonia monooxygenase, subunit AmoB [Methylacidiphilum caldifontis]|uniref:Methane monooxygenase n=1 Tax=Methylacidiphilum caldifontis TaxID=2795386 RepID=A0A4Y8PH12_9BACT|nr:bacterial ammonia monooxygenase, subunit AmoB [Methylacidiphilum caldifontis]TFE72046.1 methane monooxygenase [Methylacidiphilum caldifontis]
MKIKNWFIIPIVLACSLMLATIASNSLFASGIGERAQEAILRMRTAQFYDVRFSSNHLKVGEDLVVTGKVMILPIWPHELGFSGIGYINFFEPGPRLVRKETVVNGQPVFSSMIIKLGDTYDFKEVLTARQPGTWPVGVTMNIKDIGPIVGPSIKVTIDPSSTPYTNTVQTLTGQSVNLENYGLSRAMGWSFLWVLLGIGWLYYWLILKPTAPRLGLAYLEKEDELVTKQDQKLGLLFLGLVIVLVFGGAFIASKQFPIVVPLQKTFVRIDPLPQEPTYVEAKVNKATYNVQQRSLDFDLVVTNKGTDKVYLRRFQTANVAFLNPAAPDNQWPADSPEVNGGDLQITPNDPILPGETKQLHIKAQGAAWEVERLSTIYKESASRFGGLLFFGDTQGHRNIIAIADQFIVPVFQ